MSGLINLMETNMTDTNETTNESPAVETAIEAPAKKARKAPTKKAQVIDTSVSAVIADKPITLAVARKLTKNAKVKADKPKPVKEAKPEAKTFEGYAVNDGVDTAFISVGTNQAREALEAIGSKDKALVGSYLALGEFQSVVAPLFKSLKVYGQYLKDKLPESATLDPALRSNCKWLFEILRDGDLLSTLNVNRIEDYKSANPTVIRRDYKAIKDEAAKVAKAEELGESVEEMEAAEKASAKASKEALNKAVQEGIRQIETNISAMTAQKRAAEARILIERLIALDNKADMLTYIAGFAGQTTQPAE